ncbi:NAD(P)/FAD-dependent oxidoreductase [Streptomyces sp. NPDC001833]|uniref:NAD(P)/FAD-dependent oxidoreductase n=1 Tax=Streptomyces sp. NPDC001833 TaxID=3154658 RepID=UPI003321DD5F
MPDRQGSAPPRRRAERLRTLGWRGEITMIGDEPHRPYNRTPLSKQLLTGDRQPPDLALVTHTEPDASWRLGTRALGLDISRRELLLPGGEQLPFDGLVIASGVEARHLPGTPLHSERGWMLRTLADDRNIDAALAKARHVAVIGGGFIGCEIARTARTRALDVTIIDVSPTLLHRSLGTALGAVIGDLHRDHGVRLHLGVGVSGWSEDSRGVTVLLHDGETVRAGVAVVGTVPPHRLALAHRPRPHRRRAVRPHHPRHRSRRLRHRRHRRRRRRSPLAQPALRRHPPSR